MRKGAVLCAGAALALAGQAQAMRLGKPINPCWRHTQTFSVIDQARVGNRILAHVERALARQSRGVRQSWDTPCAAFGPSGWPLLIVSQGRFAVDAAATGAIGPQGLADGPEGFHGMTATPYAEVAWDHNLGDLSTMLSHEMIEVLVDPTDTRTINGYLADPCDPVENDSYLIRGYSVSDFVTPAWFSGGSGPWDRMNVVIAPGNVDMGYAIQVGADGSEQVVQGGPLGQ